MGGQHDDWRLEAVLAQDADRLPPVDVRQADIHDDKIDLAGLGGLHTLRAALHRTRGLLLAGRLAIPVVLGRSGIQANKREGDGSTPRGCFHLRRLWWRGDRRLRPATLLPVCRIDRATAWCEDPADRRYNRPFRRSADESGDRLWREDHLYDCVIEIDHNTRPRLAGRGSAVILQPVPPAR